MKGISISLRLAITLVSVTLLFATLVTFIYIQYERQQAYKELDAGAALASQRATHVLSSPLWNFYEKEIRALAEIEIMTPFVVSIVIRDAEGMTIVHCFKDKFGTIITDETDPQEDSPLTWEIYSSRTSLIMYNHHQIGSVEIRVTDQLVKRAMRQLIWRALGVAVLLSCILAAVVFSSLRKEFLIPLRELVMATEAVAAGDWNTKVPEGAKGEIGVLSRVFNSMVEHIRDSFRDIQVFNQKLEEQVAERTNKLLKANTKLREMDALKSSFLSSVSHELRTPLTSIVGFTQLLLRDFRQHFVPLATDEVQKKKADRIEQNIGVIAHEGQRLTRLVNDVLDLSKIEADKVEWNPRTMNPGPALRQSADIVLGTLADKPDVDFHADIQVDLPEIFIDSDRLQQVVINLLGNAVKFTDHGVVVLAARTTEFGELEISVTDTGVGIPEGFQTSIFEKFRQVGSGETLVGRSRGTGLGLTICKEIVEHFGGSIWVESEVGHGSTFFLKFPPASKADSSVSQ